MVVPARGDVSRETKLLAQQMFGAQQELAEHYADLLATAGVARGLLGPREVDRIWERHLFNCAALAPAIPLSATMVDLGSGAGLPGVAVALARPDLRVVLVEPLQRRADFLLEVVDSLGLSSVDVRRARGEELHGVVHADVVTARAVAPLGRLAAVALPLLVSGGDLLAIKGRRAAEELAEAENMLRRLGAARWVLEHWGGTMLTEPTTVVRVTVE